MMRFVGWSQRAVVVTVAFVLAVTALILWAPRHMKKEAQRAWAGSFESMEELIARYPSMPDSPAARELAALARRLGISMLPASEPAPYREGPAPGPDLRPEEAKEPLDALVSFVNVQAAKADDERLDAPPDPVSEFLSRMAGEIGAVEAHILGSDTIVWASDIHKGADAPWPSMQGQRYLESVLLVRALEAARRGDAPAAQRALEAAWKLNFILRERPEMLSQLVAIAAAVAHNGVLRRVPDVPVVWSERLASRDWRGAMLRSYQVETLHFVITAHHDLGPAGEPGWRWAAPYFDLSLAGYSEYMRHIALELRDRDPCALDVDSFNQRTEKAIPRWNLLARIAIPSLGGTWSSVGRAALDDELTRLVVLAKSQVRAPKASVPLPAMAASSACAGLRWAVTTLPSGDLQIEASRNPFKNPKTTVTLAFRVHGGSHRP